jgi:HK97 gp10 family phage protein
VTGKDGGVHVEGADELAASFTALSDDLEHLDEAGRQAGRVLAVDAQRRAPRDTGRLRASIVVDVDDHGQAVTVSAGGGRVAYAGVQEGGWPRRNIRAHHYMRDALRSQSDKVVDAYGDEVDEAVDKVRGA